jgi:hypothetical protein
MSILGMGNKGMLVYKLYKAPHPLFIPPRMLMMPFLLDVLFYIAVGVAIIEVCLGISGKTVAAWSSRVGKKLH